MKKLILSGSALLLSLGLVKAQGWNATGAHDDFVTNSEYSGITWDAGDFTMTRPGNYTLNFAASSVGGNGSSQTPAFRVDFDAMDLSAGADVQVDIENSSTVILVTRIVLEDADGIRATIEPNISDVTADLTWGSTVSGKYPRKADNGFVLAAGGRGTFRIDLSSVPGSVGGLTRTGWGGCPVDGPFCGPITSYDINVEEIVAVIFEVNYDDGRYMLSMGAGDGDHTDDYIIDAGGDVVAFNGTVILHNFKIGSELVTGTKAMTAIDRTLNVYPNPAKDILNVSFESTTGADVALTDLVGNTVFSTVANTGENKILLNTSSLTTGMYILNVSTENGKVSRKVTVK